jgi:hypothetical protein
MGAAPEVVASMAGCGAGPAGGGGGRSATVAPAPAPPSPTAPAAPTLQVVLRQARVVAAAGSGVRIPVLVGQGGMPKPDVSLVLRGSGVIDGGSGRDVLATSDDTGFVVFPLRVGRRLATYRFEVAPAAGGTLSGRPTVELVVRPGPPAALVVDPRQIVFEAGLDSIVPVAVAVRDSIGHPIPGELIVLRGNVEDMEFAPDSGVTDSLGRARFVLTRGAVRRGGALQVRVRGTPRAWLEVMLGAPLAESETGFRPPAAGRGAAGMVLPQPIVFEARTRLGTPAVGRAVAFRAVNAEVSPATTVTDSAGRARIDVTLGGRAGPAVVIATIDSVEKHVTLQVDPGLAVELALEHNGVRVDGGRLAVFADASFTIHVRARDASANPTATAGIARLLRENQAQFGSRLRLIRLVAVAEEPTSVVLTFKAVQVGSADLTITAGLSATVRVEVVPSR